MNKELAKTYNPKEIEEKLYEKWCENKYFHAEVDRGRETVYNGDATSEYYRKAAYGTCARQHIAGHFDPL